MKGARGLSAMKEVIQLITRGRGCIAVFVFRSLVRRESSVFFKKDLLFFSKYYVQLLTQTSLEPLGVGRILYPVGISVYPYNGRQSWQENCSL